MPYSAQISQNQDEHNIYVIMKRYMLLCLSYFCEIWALCVSWITYDHLWYTSCLACWALFGSLVPAICNRTSCAQVHELQLPQNHCGDNRGHIIYIHTIKLFPSLINCSISCTIEWFNRIMVKMQIRVRSHEGRNELIPVWDFKAA